MSAILAKILNSTVGTSSLKALDTILKTDNTTIANNAADRLFNSLKNSSKLVGSDDVMFNYTGTWTGGYGHEVGYGFTNDDYVYIANSYIKFDASGTVIIKTLQKGLTDATYSLRVMDVNGNKVGETVEKLPPGEYAEMLYSLNVTSGVKYKILVAVRNGTSPLQNFEVCGKTMLLGATVTATT